MGERPPEESVAERLARVLDGRSPWKWAEQVHLSSGAVSRMMKGSLPDPEKLIPAIYMENLSLSWLVSGYGTPYLVQTPATEEQAVQWVRAHMKRPSDPEILVVHSDEGYTPVLHALAIGADKSGAEFTYRSVTIMGGYKHSPKVMDAILEASAMQDHGEPASRVRSIEIMGAGWRLLAGGHLGTYKIFGEGDGGLYGKAHLDVARPELVSYRVESKVSFGQVREPAATWLDSSQREMHALFEGLSPADRDVALRMLRGLRYDPEA